MIDTHCIISTYFNRAVVRGSGFTLIMILPFLLSCSSKGETGIDTKEFEVIQPTRMDTAFTREYVAEIQSIKNIELRSRVSGFIEKIYVDEGQNVKAGQLLFTISDKVFRDELQKAKAELKSTQAESKVAEVELGRTKNLVEKNIISNSELEMAKAKFEALEARVDEAKSSVSTAELNLSFASIKAPFNGVINRIPNKIGSLIEEGTLLTTLSDNSEVYAYFNVSEKEYLDYVSQKDNDTKHEVTLMLSNGSIHPYKGKVETIEGEIDKSTGNIAFRARFANPQQILKHGSSGKVIVRNKLNNVLLIPQKTTFEIQDLTYVYVVGKDNVVHVRKIVPSVRLSHLYVVGSGVDDNDIILYEGIQLAKDGERITIKKIVPPEFIKQ
jgi:membrane fusion protein (multidrug efflux system)